MTAEQGGASPILPINEAEQAWNMFASTGRDWASLTRLLSHPLQPAYEQRILQVILSPDAADLPFTADFHPRKIQDRVGSYETFNQFLNVLTGARIPQAADLVEEYAAQAGQRADKEAPAMINAYNVLIAGLAPQLPDDRADQLFSHYRVLNPNDYMTVRMVLENSGIRDSHKRIITKQVHQLLDNGVDSKASEVSQEEQARRQNRIDKYADMFEEMVERPKLGISKTLFQEEVVWLLPRTEDTLFSARSRETLGKILDLLDDPVRHDVLMHDLIAPHGDNSIYRFHNWRVNGERTAEIAKRILELYPQDNTLRAKLIGELDVWGREQAAKEAAQNRVNQEEQAVLAKLRIPQKQPSEPQE